MSFFSFVPWFAIALSIGSSTDNFSVGASLGLLKLDLDARTNLIISLANGAGSWLSAAGGVFLSTILPEGFSSLLTSAAFTYLSLDEFLSWKRNEDSNLVQKAKDGAVIGLAVPMTLSNLGGGLAGGASGITPITSGICGFLASFIMMKLGHILGSKLGPALSERVDTRIVSSMIFGALAISQLIDASSSWSLSGSLATPKLIDVSSAWKLT